MTPSQIWPAIGWSSYCDKRKLWSLRKALFECEKSSLRIGMRAHPATHMSWVWGCWRPLALRPGCSQVLRLFLDPQFSSWRLQRPLSPRRKGLICVEPEVEIRYSKHKQESPIWNIPWPFGLECLEGNWGQVVSFEKKRKREDLEWIVRASLVAQWLRIRLPMQGTRVRALVQEDPTCRGATKPVRHNCWACALEPASHNCWSLHAATTEANAPRARAPQQEKPLQWEARAPQWRVAPTRCN